MGFRPKDWVDRKLRRRAQMDWARVSRSVPAFSLGRLRHMRGEAAILRRDLDRFLQESDRRIAQSRASLDAVPLPGGTDWRWRPRFLATRLTPTGLAMPQSGAKLNEDTAVWHDCAAAALTLRQIQNADAADLAAFGLRIESLGFTGTFLSLAIDMPPSALAGLTRNHIIRVETVLQAEHPVSIYGRLNIGNGPNTEEILRHMGEMTELAQAVVAEFDLAVTEMNEKRLDKIWLDLIVEQPEMNAITIREMILSRHPRANV